jgi:hypothetical protein
LQWVVGSYTPMFAALILTAGAFGDRFGARRIYTIGIFFINIPIGPVRDRRPGRGARPVHLRVPRRAGHLDRAGDHRHAARHPDPPAGPDGRTGGGRTDTHLVRDH